MLIEDVLILGVFIILQFLVLFIAIFFLRKRQLWPLIRAGLSGHGTLIQKILPDGGASFYYSGKFVDKVLWKIKDNAGKTKTVFTPIEGIKHHLSGTAIPLHICPFNAGSNISILREKDKELTAKEQNELAVFQYMNGYNAARKLYQTKPGFDFNWKILVIIGIIVVVAVVMWPSLSAQLATVQG